MYSPLRFIPDIVRKGRPIHLTFFVTTRCNSACPFCFSLRSADAPAERGPELSLREVERISPSLGRLLWLAFSGGEIFLRADLAEIAGTFYRNNKPAIMLFPTNGLMPELISEQIERILRACPGSLVVLKLSLDGVGSAHDELRGTPGGFEKALRTYNAVAGLPGRYRNFELGVNTVFCSGNQDGMDAIIAFVRGMDAVRTHTISLVRGNLRDRRYGEVDAGKYGDAVRTLERNLRGGKAPVYRFRGGRLKAAQDILQRRLIERTLRERRRTLPCYAGRLNLVLSATGEVYPCELLASSFGNVRDQGYDVRKTMESDAARNVRAAIGRKSCCCTHECYFMTNILFNPRMYPALLGEYVRLRPARR